MRGKSSVVFLQNGMSHLHAMQKIENENIAVGIVEHGAKKKKRHTVYHTGIGVTKFGIVRGRSIHFEKYLIAFLFRIFQFE
ncbi:2-dehydropantoate 2-reductase N-terminal domain-containing protein [Bacillus paranthracis]